MPSLFARKALLSLGWAENVRLQLRAGRIAGLDSGVSPDPADETVDVLIPGLCNAHSHAFQRALAGRTEQRSPNTEDNFWSWRTRMYELANRITADQLCVIATQAYAEMLAAGYTSVAEFHYLHGEPADDADAMFRAVQTAAANSGIRLIYVPVFYERGGFATSEPLPQQRRFVMTLSNFLAHHERCTQLANATTTVAIGAHSLRAVTASSLQTIASLAREQRVPMHLHIAEQLGEIEQCIAATGQRPVEWLLGNLTVNEQWCLVHATHMSPAETTALAATNAVVCLCPTTEANLGDGLFPLAVFLDAGGRIAIGSDSQVSIDPFEELRWLEYGQRLVTQSRNLVSLDGEHVGQELFDRVLAGGAQAGGLALAGLAEGAVADLVTLSADDPMLAGHDETTFLDALVFSGYRLPVDRVMVAGEWQVGGGEHRAHAANTAGFAAVMRSLR